MSRFVVTGTGRSGTRYTSHLLRAAGVECGHEQVFTFRVAFGQRPLRWGRWAADSSWLAVPKLSEVDVPVVLVVRHPLKVVHSMLQLGWFADDQRRDVAKVIYAYRPEVQAEQTRADKALAMWVWWNTAALPYASHVARLEDMDVPALLAAVGVGRVPTPAALAAIRGDAEKANTKADRKQPTPPPRWAGFRPPLADAARNVAGMFGYETEGDGSA